MYRKIYSHANSIRVMMMMMTLTICDMMTIHGQTTPSDVYRRKMIPPN